MGLGPHHGPNTRPSCRCAAGQGVRHLPLASQAPFGSLSCSAAALHTLPDGLDARVSDRPTPCPAASLSGGGASPPVNLGSVGAATRLAAAYGRRLPLARLVPLGRELRRGPRAAWRLPHRFAAAPKQPATHGQAYKSGC